MTVIVSPDADQPTHHISLSDGFTTIGLIASNAQGDSNPFAITRAPVTRTAMKTTSGNAKYSDYEPPWTPIAQEDWSGGRGNDDFDKDTTRYFDGYRANTMFGKIMHGPQEQYSTGLRNAGNNLPGNVTWWNLITGTGKYIANRYIPATSYTTGTVWLLIRRRGTPTSDLTVKLCSDNAGVPGTVLQTATVTTTDITDTLSEWWIFSVAQAITSGTTYWIQTYSATGTDSDHWEIGCSPTHVYGKQSADGSAWTNSTVDLYYRVTEADSNLFVRFFQYKRGLYLVRSIASATSTLWINGDRGTADANTGALTTLIDATKTWATNEWAGCYAVLYAGKGSNEDQTWRKIVSNTATTLTLDATWEIEHDTTTEYVIVGSNKWTEITGHGLAAKVTDVLVVNNIIYFAQGDSTLIRHAKFETSAGTWTPTYRDDGTATNKATYLQLVRNASSGSLEVWRANNIDLASKISVSKSATIAWGANFAFGTTEGTDKCTFEDSFGKITGLEEYGDTAKYLWVFREGTIYAINAGKPDEIPLREVRTLMSDSNGKAHTIHNAYMYINLGGGLQQYYNRQLTDVGTNRDEGLPANRRGPVTDLQGYPGRLFEAIDAGTTGYSQVHGYNLTGWHEHYRAPKGQRIGCMEYEVIPGEGLDRLWVQQGNDVLYLPFPSGTLDPSRDDNYLFTHEAAIESSWIYAGLPDVVKLNNSFKIFAEELEEDTVWVELDYKVDEETDWTVLDEQFFTTPVAEYDLSTEGSVQGKRFKFRIRSYTKDASKTGIIKSTVVETISRVPIKYSYALAYRLQELGVDLRGKPETQGTPDEIQAIIDDWAANLTRLTMRCVKKIFDDKRLFIDPPPMSITGEVLENYTGKLTMIEV